MCRYKTGRTRTNNSERRRPSPQLPTPDYVTIPTRLMSYHYCPLDASYTCRTDNTTALTKKQTVSLKRLPMLPTLLYCFTLHLSLDRHDDFQRSKDDSFHMNRYYYSWLTVTACRWIYLGTIRYIGQQWSRYYPQIVFASRTNCLDIYYRFEACEVVNATRYYLGWPRRFWVKLKPFSFRVIHDRWQVRINRNQSSNYVFAADR